MPTRIGKIAGGSVDLVLLAAAGLDRLGLTEQIAERLDPEQFCPAACQGILAIEIRRDDTELAELLAPLNHGPTAIVAAAERAVLRRLEGGCQVPMACYATLEGGAEQGGAEQGEGRLHVHGLVVDPEGEPLFEARRVGHPGQAAELGRELAETLLGLGAGAIIDGLASRGAAT